MSSASCQITFPYTYARRKKKKLKYFGCEASQYSCDENLLKKKKEQKIICQGLGPQQFSYTFCDGG